MKHFDCSLLLPGCAEHFAAETVEQVVALATTHAAASHGLVGRSPSFRMAVAATVI